MRIRVVVWFLLLAACHNKSRLDGVSAAEVDTLWELAPDGLEVGVVGSGRAMGMIARALTAAHEVIELPDFGSLRPQLDLVTSALLGGPTATFADAGFAIDRGFALFVSHDGVIAVMPVADRDKFLAAKHGKRGSGEDTLDGGTCKEVRGVYACASSEPMFERIGKAPVRGKLTTRGDVELFAPNLALMAGTAGDLAVAAQLEVGRVAVTARWTGQPAGTLGKLSGALAPHVDPTNASGFVAIDIAPLIAELPPLPIAGGVTADQLAKTIIGPVSIVIPTGSIDLQIHVPLSDPAPAIAVIEHCKELGLFELAPTQTPGACRFQLQAASVLELDAWVEGKELRIGAHKGVAAAGSPTALTPEGTQLAAGAWTGVFWGRGTMLNLEGITPATAEMPPQAALGIHAIALVNELGAAIKLDKTGVELHAILRTAWDNPPDVVAKIVAIDGAAIVQGKATAPAKAIAAAAPSSPFAADFAAGQGGLMVPAAAIGLVSAVVVPAFERYLRGDEPAPSEDPDEAEQPDPQRDPTQLVAAIVHAYADNAYPKWLVAHPDKTCPSSLAELAGYLDVGGESPPLVDPWNHPFVIACGKDLPKGAIKIGVSSLGPDGQAGTADDIHSW